MKLFDLDKTVSEAVSATLRYQLIGDGAVGIEVRMLSASRFYTVPSCLDLRREMSVMVHLISPSSWINISF